MSGTADTEFSLGDQYYVLAPHFSEGLLGTIVALTNAPGKRIGIQFETDVQISRHDCDGIGEFGKCLWTKPGEIYNPTEWLTFQDELNTQAVLRKLAVGDSFSRITIDNDGDVIIAQSDEDARSSILDVGDADDNFAPAAAE